MMKLLYTAFCLFGSLLAYSQKTNVNLSPDENSTIDLPKNKSFDVRIKNKSFKTIEVKVLDANNEFVRGFGLAGLGKEEVFVEEGNTLNVINNSEKNTKISYKLTEKSPAKIVDTRKSVSFTLANNTAKSIPLIIPTVMNPNLSPFSKSGVDLVVGQEIFFKYNGKKKVLLIVDQNIQEGDIVDVAKILSSRKKDLKNSK